jgi:cold-inducible RNA-binding protein
MPVRLFVGNLPYDASEAELRQHFAAVGQLSHVFIPVDRETGRPRGFAFVEFAERAQAEGAIARLNNQSFKGRPLSVSEARAREERPAGPRPSGPPRSDWSPRPPSVPGSRSAPSDSTAGAGPLEGRRRDFGPDAPPKGRGRGKVARQRRDEKPGGPIPIRSGGRIYDVDDVEESGPEVEFDDFARSEPVSDEDKNE